MTDEDILTALDLRDHEHLTAGQIARRMGKTRSAICGVFKRVKDAEAPGRAGDGTMPRGWWRR